MTNNEKANKMYEEYNKGFSLSEVGRMFGMSRQAVYCMLKVRKYELRKKKELPYQYFNNIKFTPQSNGYFRKSDGDRELMHRYVWRHYNGIIPEGHDIHHINMNRADNNIKNLEMLRKDEHTRKYASGNNQYTKKGEL
jgi:hypothetical protein